MRRLQAGFPLAAVVGQPGDPIYGTASDKNPTEIRAIRARISDAERSIMTYATHTDRALGGASVGQFLSGLKDSLAQRLAQHQAYRSSLSELAMLTDRELADLGIHRADIRGIAQNAAYGA